MKGFGVAEYMYVVISTEPVHLLSARVKLMTSEGEGCEWKRRHSLVNRTDEEVCNAVTTRSRLQQVTNDPGPLSSQLTGGTAVQYQCCMALVLPHTSTSPMYKHFCK